MSEDWLAVVNSQRPWPTPCLNKISEQEAEWSQEKTEVKVGDKSLVKNPFMTITTACHIQWVSFTALSSQNPLLLSLCLLPCDLRGCWWACTTTATTCSWPASGGQTLSQGSYCKTFTDMHGTDRQTHIHTYISILRGQDCRKKQKLQATGRPIGL